MSRFITSILLLACAAAAVNAAPARTRVGIVSHVKALSDKVPDLSSLEAWKRATIKDGMTDREKAMAVWKTVVSFQYQDAPPVEYLQVEELVLDPIKVANVYGYSYCSVASADVQCLARYAGLQARGWTIQGHVVPEIFWGGKWHLLDASLITYFPGPDGEPLGVQEVVDGVKAWYAEHPEFKGDEKKLVAFMQHGGWRKGPEVLSRCPLYDENGWLPAATHGWYATMQEYSGKTLFPYEAGYSQGYEVNVQLREGERLTRNWSNQGLHVNGPGSDPDALKEKVGQGGLRYAPKFGDIAPGRVGNGTWEYEVPLANGAFRGGALLAQNLVSKSEDRNGPALHLRPGAASGAYVVRMHSPYVYLGGEVTLKPVVAIGGGISVSFSDNNGLDWKPLAEITRSGEQRLDLKPLVLRRYDYQLKFVFRGAGTGLDALKFSHAIQHSQRPLPALTAGENKISFSSDDEGTVTIEGSTEAANKGKQLLYTDFHPQLTGIAPERLVLSAGTGEVTFPVHTPGEMKRLRIGLFYRARDKADGWKAEASFDGGKTYRPVGSVTGPTVGSGQYFVFSDVPAGVHDAVVRLAGVQRNTTMLYNLRIDADYREPNGGFRPVKVTYRWEEDGQPKEDVHVVRSASETYSVRCASKPMMKSVCFELAP